MLRDIDYLVPILGTDHSTPAVCDAEADVEAPYTISGNNSEVAKMMARASVHGRIVLLIFASAKSGSPSFTIDSISGTIDGTNYAILQSFAPISITANGEQTPVEITVPLPPNLTKIRLDITVTTLSGSHYISLFAGLYLEV